MMISKYFIGLLSCLYLVSTNAPGAKAETVEPNVTVYGTLLGFSGTFVKIANGPKRHIEIPREYVSSPLDGLISGKAKVKARVPLSVFMKNHFAEKASEKKRK